MPIGLANRRRRAVPLEEGATPGGDRCPACGEPLFVWVERGNRVIDRCENCGLAVGRDAVPSPEDAARAFLATAEQHGERIAVRTDNAASLQTGIGAENWTALRDVPPSIKPTPRAMRLLLARRGLEVRRVRYPLGVGMAHMWQTLLNLLTFHRDFAAEVVSGRLRPTTGRGRAAFWLDAVITALAAVPTAIVAVLLEGVAVLARRGGVIEIEAERLPSTS